MYGHIIGITLTAVIEVLQINILVHELDYMHYGIEGQPRWCSLNNYN